MASRDIEVDLRVYSLAAVRKAAAALSDRCATQIAQCSEDHAVVTLIPLDRALLLDEAAQVFLRLLLDHTQQEVVAEQTKDVRVALVRAALAEALKPPVGRK